jgi:hypothetical protein
MRAQRLMVVVAVLAVAGVLLVATGPAALGKEDVTARLLTPLRLDAAPGEGITVVWGLGWTDEHGRRQPFNAIGVLSGCGAPLVAARRSGSRPRMPTPKDATTPRWPCPRAGSAGSRSGWAAPATGVPAMCCSRWRMTRSRHQPAAWTSHCGRG